MPAIKKFKINKKGLSTVVSVVLVMVLSIALAGIVGTTLIKFANLSLSPAVSCTQLQISSPVSIEDACYDSSTGQARVLVKRAIDSPEISEFSLALGSSKWSCTQSCGSCNLLGAGDTRTYYLPVQDFNIQQDNANTLTLSVDSCTLTSAQIKACS